MRVREHLSGKSGISAINEHISSCKDCHSYSISNFNTLAQANTDFEVKIKEALHMKKHKPKLNNQIYLCGSSFLLNILLNKLLLYLLKEISFHIFKHIVLGVTKLRRKHLKRNM